MFRSFADGSMRKVTPVSNTHYPLWLCWASPGKGSKYFPANKMNSSLSFLTFVMVSARVTCLYTLFILWPWRDQPCVMLNWSCQILDKTSFSTMVPLWEPTNWHVTDWAYSAADSFLFIKNDTKAIRYKYTQLFPVLSFLVCSLFVFSGHLP
jgi:hypothetical protein